MKTQVFVLTAIIALITAAVLLGDSTPMSSVSILKPITLQATDLAMPSFIFSTLMVANGTITPLSGWQYEYLPWPAVVSVLARSTLANVVQTYTSGSETIVEESPVQAGGTIGVTPSPLNTPEINWQGAAGDRLKLSIRETAAGTPTIDGIIEVTPL